MHLVHSHPNCLAAHGSADVELALIEIHAACYVFWLATTHAMHMKPNQVLDFERCPN